MCLDACHILSYRFVCRISILRVVTMAQRMGLYRLRCFKMTYYHLMSWVMSSPQPSSNIWPRVVICLLMTSHQYGEPL